MQSSGKKMNRDFSFKISSLLSVSYKKSLDGAADGTNCLHSIDSSYSYIYIQNISLFF